MKHQNTNNLPLTFLFQHGSPQVSTTCAIQIGLTNLPPELLVHIAKFLDPISAVCLTLSCKLTYAQLRPYSLKYSLKWEPEGDRPFYEARPCYQLQLIKLLERDLPNHVACRHCRTLHAVQNIQRYINPQQGHYNDEQCIYDRYLVCPLLALCQASARKHQLIFAFPAVQMTMKLYHQKDSKELESVLELFTKNLKVSFHVENKVWRAVYCSEARIVNGSFLLRVQEAHSFLEEKKEALQEQHQIQVEGHEEEVNMKTEKQLEEEDEDESNPLIHRFWAAHMCRHMDDLRYNHVCNQDKIMRIDYSWGEWRGLSHSKARMGKLNQCKACWTEFRVEWKEFPPLSTSSSKKKTKTLLITRWMDMGEGKDPYTDRKWRSLAEKPYELYCDQPRYVRSRKNVLPAKLPPSVCKAFEGNAYEGFDAGSSLSKEHLEHLFGDELESTQNAVV